MAGSIVLNAVNTEEKPKENTNNRSPTPTSLNHSPEQDMLLRSQ